MEPVEYTLSSHELFLIVAQTVWDFFLVSLFAVAASFLVCGPEELFTPLHGAHQMAVCYEQGKQRRFSTPACIADCAYERHGLLKRDIYLLHTDPLTQLGECG